MKVKWRTQGAYRGQARKGNGEITGKIVGGRKASAEIITNGETFTGVGAENSPAVCYDMDVLSN